MSQTRSDMGVPRKKKEYLQVLKLIKEGWSPQDIANEVGVAYRTVLKWRQDVPPHQRAYDRRYHKAKELRQQGWTREQLAERFGVSPTTISRWLKLVKTRKVHFQEEYNHAMELYLKHGWNARKIARAVKVSESTVYRWMQDVPPRGAFPKHARVKAVKQQEKAEEEKKWEGWEDV